MAGGRPTKYEAEFAEQALKLSLLGATDEELADFFDVNVATLNRWKKSHPEFCASIKEGKRVADAEVAHSLYQRALNGDTTAAIFWLKNRRKQNWRDKQEIDHGVTDELAEVMKAIDGRTRGLPSGD